ncbi:MAG: hypothetical protein N2327_05330, partial [Caldimicrobium sp.]|nr:hypothetical protein [Caldimicrobium sp.]
MRIHSSLGYVVPEDIWRLKGNDRDEVNERGVQERGLKNNPQTLYLSKVWIQPNITILRLSHITSCLLNRFPLYF